MSTMQIRITAFVNTDRDNFDGYQLAHKLAPVDVFVEKAIDDKHAAERMFGVGNRMGSDLHGLEWPRDVRSLSVGDVLKIVLPNTFPNPGGKIVWLACDNVGWREIPEPSHSRFVPIAGTRATARQVVRTRYASHANSNVGDIVVRMDDRHGKRHEHHVRYNQALSADGNRIAAAEGIARRYGMTLLPGAPTWEDERIATLIATPIDLFG